jgi:hypothetical protein
MWNLFIYLFIYLFFTLGFDWYKCYFEISKVSKNSLITMQVKLAWVWWVCRELGVQAVSFVLTDNVPPNNVLLGG